MAGRLRRSAIPLAFAKPAAEDRNLKNLFGRNTRDSAQADDMKKITRIYPSVGHVLAGKCRNRHKTPVGWSQNLSRRDCKPGETRSVHAVREFGCNPIPGRQSRFQ